MAVINSMAIIYSVNGINIITWEVPGVFQIYAVNLSNLASFLSLQGRKFCKQ